jgi:hypothetical protein
MLGGPAEAPTMAKKLVLPRVQVMILCDEIEARPEEEEIHDLLGVRTRIRADGFPYTHPQLCVDLQITGHQGTTRCHITLVDAETDDEVFTGPSQDLDLQGSLVVLPVGFWLEDCRFGSPGLYYAQVYCDGKLVCERPFRVAEE